MARSNNLMGKASGGRAGRGAGVFAGPNYKPRSKRIPDSFHRGFAPGLRARAAAAAPKPSTQRPGLGTAPGKPAAPAAKPVQGQHAAPDALYNSQVNLANREQTQRVGALEGQEQATKHEFGIGDPTNPFSRMEGLKRTFLAQSKAASASLASQGHLYSGQHERALARTRLQEEEARANLRSAFDQAISGIGDQKTAAKFQTEEQKNQAFEDWLARAPEAEDLAGGPAPAAVASKAAPAAPQSKPAPRPAAAAVKPGSGRYGAGVNQLLANIGQGPGTKRGGTATQRGPNTASGRGKVQVKAKARPKVKAKARGRSKAKSRFMAGRGATL